MKPSVLVLGSGPIRIGQGIEFDYSCVHCVWALEKMGYRAVIVNNNPETVSTDFDTGDALYFEPVTLPDVVRIVEREKPVGVAVQFGGQTAINLAAPLQEAGVKVLGTSPEAIAAAEDRGQFDDLLERLGISRPKGRAVRSLAEAAEVAHKVGYPVLVRPSFVLGGRAMEIVFDRESLDDFYREAEDANPGQPVLVDKYLLGIEAEVDVISDGTTTLVPGIMQHIERAGVHSGDSMAVYPPTSIAPVVQAEMVDSACRIAKELGIRGLMNIQFVITGSEDSQKVNVLEVNPRASRTVPYLSKVTGIAMVELATRCMMGEQLAEHGYASGLWLREAGLSQPSGKCSPRANGKVVNAAELAQKDSLPEPVLYAVKAPVFSFQKLSRVEPSLGPEMKSTGEILGLDFTYPAALYKALLASGIQFLGEGCVLISVQDSDKAEAVAIARKLRAIGRTIAATRGTHAAISAAGVECEMVSKISEGSPNLLDLILDGKVSMMINTPSLDRNAELEAARIRRGCIETGIPCMTSIDTATALLSALDVFADPLMAECLTLPEYLAGRVKA